VRVNGNDAKQQRDSKNSKQKNKNKDTIIKKSFGGQKVTGIRGKARCTQIVLNARKLKPSREGTNQQKRNIHADDPREAKNPEKGIQQKIKKSNREENYRWSIIALTKKKNRGKNGRRLTTTPWG